MSGTYKEGTQPLANRNISINAGATSTILSYPLAFTRKDMSNQERIKYTYEWVTYEQIWSYNYTVSTLNGSASNYANSPWQFANKNEQLAYTNGQVAHMEYYSTAGAAGQFDNIRF